MFMSFSKNKFTLLWQNLVTDSVRHVGAHPGEHQHGVSIQISISLGKTFLRISRIQNIPLTWIVARVFVYVPPFISQILHFIYWKVLIFILVYFEWRDTKNQQYKYADLLGLFYTCWWWMNNRVDESWLWAESQVWTKNWNVCIKEDRRAREEKNCMTSFF